MSETNGGGFEFALWNLKHGLKVAREGWNGKGMYVGLAENPRFVSDTTDGPLCSRSYLYMKTADNEYVPWVASQTDLLADDWKIVG